MQKKKFTGNLLEIYSVFPLLRRRRLYLLIIIIIRTKSLAHATLEKEEDNQISFLIVENG